MGLVDYSDSEEEDGELQRPSAKKRRLSRDTTTTTLPPLPTNFRDLYSSTVRTSTQDDPSLHAGRKRVTPHVVGNWPAHVYLEWTPEKKQKALLTDSISNCNNEEQDEIHSLLENNLGVPLPLHISLSRPLTLKTTTKDTFLTRLTTSIKETSVRAFTAAPSALTWHPNEDRTRYFLVLSLQRPESDELRGLLEVCNQVAGEFEQPLLYRSAARKGKGKVAEVEDGKFHLSVAWSLSPQEGEVEVPEELKESVRRLKIKFEEVKVRIGQDVTGIPLRRRRGGVLGSGE